MGKVLVLVVVVCLLVFLWEMRTTIFRLIDRKALDKQRVAWHVVSGFQSGYKVYWISDGVDREEVMRIDRRKVSRDSYDAICLSARIEAENEAAEKNLG